MQQTLRTAAATLSKQTAFQLAGQQPGDTGVKEAGTWDGTTGKKSPRSIQKVYFSDLETRNTSRRGKIHGSVKDEERKQEKTQARIRHFFRGSWNSCPDLGLGGQRGKAMRKHLRQKEKVILILPSELIFFFFLQTHSFLETQPCLLGF